MNYLSTKDQQASWADTANGVNAWLSLGFHDGVLPGVVTRTLPPSDSCIMSLNNSIHKREFRQFLPYNAIYTKCSPEDHQVFYESYINKDIFINPMTRYHDRIEKIQHRHPHLQ